METVFLNGEKDREMNKTLKTMDMIIHFCGFFSELYLYCMC